MAAAQQEPAPIAAEPEKDVRDLMNPPDSPPPPADDDYDTEDTVEDDVSGDEAPKRPHSAKPEGAEEEDEGEEKQSEEEEREIVSLQRKLNLYERFFGEIVGKVGKANANCMDVEKLRKAVSDSKWAVCMMNSADLYKEQATMILIGAEHVGTQYLGLKLKGLTASMVAGKRFEGLLNEMLIESSDMLYMEPWKRFLMTVASTGYQVHCINSAEEKKKQDAMIATGSGTPMAVEPSPAPQGPAKPLTAKKVMEENADL